MTQFEKAYTHLRKMLDDMFCHWDNTVYVFPPEVVDETDHYFDVSIHWDINTFDKLEFNVFFEGNELFVNIYTPSESWERVRGEETIWKILYFQQL